MKNFIVLLCSFCSFFAVAGNMFSTVAESDLVNSVFSGKTLKVLDKDWKFCKSDKKEYALPDFNDTAWQDIKINTSLAKENRSAYYWYRVSFDLPETPEKGFYELELGYVSAGDQAFLNGVKCGEYGFSKVVRNSSDHRRRYRFINNGNILKKGKNVLAVRVKNGHKSGMYEGIPFLRKLDDCQIIGKLNSRSSGKGAVHRHITSVEAINEFYPEDRLFIAPALTVAGVNKKLAGVLEVSVKQNSKTINLFKKDLVLQNGKWLNVAAEEIKNPGIGSYQVICKFSVDGKVVQQYLHAFTVQEKKQLPITVEESLHGSEDLPVKVGEYSFGSFGLRDVDKENKLFDNYNTPDARGGVGNVLGISKKYPGIVLLHSHVKSSGTFKSADFIDQMGWQYDGLIDGWSSGWIRPASSKVISNISTLATTWTGKKIRFDYPGKEFIDVSISQLSPALAVSSNRKEIIFFENQSPLGAPTLLLGERSGKLVDLGKEVSVFEHNYLVISFRGSQNWNEFDIPYLMVFEKRPRQVQLLPNGVKVSFAGKSGTIRLMPLYGVKLQAQDHFEADILKRCKFYSQALLAMPEKVTRTIKVDYASNNILVRDKFFRNIVKDDWNTKPLICSPVPPSLMLASSSDLKTAISHPVFDMEYAGLNGPMYAVKDSDSYTFVIKNVVNSVTEVRKSKDLKETLEVKQLKKELLDTVRRKVIPEISKHPWQTLVANSAGKAWNAGALEEDFTNLLLTMQFLPENVKKRIIKEVTAEAPNFIDPDLKAIERKKGKSTAIKVNTSVCNPLSGKELTTSTRHVMDNAIDGPCWESLRIYLLWSFAYHCNGWELLKKNQSELEKSYNLLVNSHDWAYSLCWDAFAGCRIGNGLQESSIFHAGFAAYARIMHQMGNIAERDRAVYYSLIQLVGMGSSVSPETIKFARNNRPVLPEHHQAAEVDMLDTSYPDRYCEINERGGFFSWIMMPTMPYYDRIIMTRLPEVMRPFKEYFGSFSQKHFSGRRNGKMVCRTQPFQLDIFSYVTPQMPFSLKELYDLRKDKRIDLYERLADYRALLEANSKIYYEKLWVK